MPFPKLSAVLNNCPLHALTPEIKLEVLKFGENGLYDNQHTAGYSILKDKFAVFYGFNPAEFTWSTFAGILKCYNAFDTQIILGPVLRSFMKEPMAHDELLPSLAAASDTSPELYINSMTEVQPDTSRYASLAPDEVYQYASKELGLSLIYHPQEGEATQLEASNALSTVHIFHQGGIDGAQFGGHWERTDRGLESLDIQNQDDTQLNEIIQLLGQNIGVNPFGFELLKKHVQITARTQEKHNESIQFETEFAELNIAVTQILKYLNNINSVPKIYAIRLLGNGLSEITRRFIEEYDFVEVEHNLIFEQWIRALDEFKPTLNAEEQQLINRLMAPVPQSFFPVNVEATLPNEQDPNRELAEALQAIERFEMEQREKNLLESEQLARRLQDEELLARDKVERTLPASQQLEQDTQNVHPEDEISDTREQLAHMLATGQIALGQDDEEQRTNSDKPLSMKILLAQQEFQKHLDSLKNKMDDLATRRNEHISNPEKFDALDKAWNAANDLHMNIAIAGDLYFSAPSPQAYNKFESTCKTLINSAHSKLDKHRGWTEFLVNFALGILTLGVGLIIKGLFNLATNKSFFFVHKTKSSELLDDIENDVHNSAPAA
ncbi:effector protein B, substrate of the Dot/Icm secretion system [Legionella moravica]|uniref:Effector protein B, substrate of the Dot/Icm secretion system n=1 Tax=Legionella moravica TaxID=39962 RepID=A0A378K6V6_9GAMM|nr:hypothetical protein [Legionella moravica]KTD30984.1 effector protein B, substrate of the Dot/Icm secretion system [Legionella moravica]STX63561.1 Uncharacterised protein [Legionella moravica]